MRGSPPSLLADRHGTTAMRSRTSSGQDARRVLHGEGQLPLPELSRVVSERGHADIMALSGTSMSAAVVTSWYQDVIRARELATTDVHPHRTRLRPSSNSPPLTSLVLTRWAREKPGPSMPLARSRSLARSIRVSRNIHGGSRGSLRRSPLFPMVRCSIGRSAWSGAIDWCGGFDFTRTSRLGLSDWCGAIG